MIFSIVSVWSKCSHCDYVWRSSVLRTIIDCALGTAGLRRPTRKLEAYVAANAASLKLDANDADVEVEVDAWAAIENPPSSWTVSEDATVEAFCESLSHDASRSIRAAGSKRKTESMELNLAASAERMVKNVETVCDTFERLEQQFAGLEQSCSEMLA